MPAPAFTPRTAPGVPQTPSGHQPSTGDRRSLWSDDWAFSLALLVIAFAARLLIGLALAREPIWDGHYYHFGAERLAAGFGYSEDATILGRSVWKPWAHYPVGYSAFLSLGYRVFGPGLVVAPILNAVVGALLALVVHRLARYMLSENRSRIAGALCALHPGLIAYSAAIMTEPLAGLLVAAAGWAAVSQPKTFKGAAWAGVFLGLGTLVRPSSLLAAPFLFFCFARPLGPALLRTALASLVTLLTLLPWSYRNCRVMDGCALVSTNGGWNLAIGALTTTGRFQTLRAADGCPVVTGQVQQDRCWSSVGWSLIRQDPLLWLRKIPAKLSQTYDHESFPIEYLHEAAPELWPEARREVGRELLTWFHRALMVLAAISPVARFSGAPRRAEVMTQGMLLALTAAAVTWVAMNPEHPFYLLMVALPFVAALPLPGAPTRGAGGGYIYGVLLATTVTHAVFFGDDRYHLIVSPFLCILAAGAWRGHFSFGVRNNASA